MTGLSCAIELLNNGFEVELFESRQEIGNPVRSPGLISELDQEMIEKSVAKLTPIGWGMRREWFEKTLAKRVVTKGGKINLKKTAPPNSIDCTGGKSPSPGWPSKGTQNNLEIWNGGIVISRDLPSEFEINTMSEDRVCFQRGDGLVECWIRGELPQPSQGWLELMQGEHPSNSDLISADHAITTGREIAQNIIQSRPEVSNNDSR